MKREIKAIFCIVLLAGLVSSGCVPSPEVIKDIRTLKQDNIYYLDKDTCEEEPVTEGFHKIMDQHFNKNWFLPWHKDAPQYSLEEVSWGFERYGDDLGYGENRRRHTEEWIEDLRELANLDEYPNKSLMAITIKHSNLRVLPTNKPHFSDFDRAGQGYPFDNMQNSAIWANTPVYISHMSKDGSWVLAESPFALGWMPVTDIAFVDGDFIKSWEEGEFIAFTKDRVPVYDTDSLFRFFAYIGIILPKTGEDDEDFECLFAVSDETGRAKMLRCRISKESAVSKPLKITSGNIAGIANELLNQPYGWGGMYENRDCSATMRDLFTPSGIWLPRNSTDQAKAGIFFSLKDLSPKNKEAMIIENGIPYLALIWVRGHIMLYIGHSNGRVLVFHNMWGLRTRHSSGKEGRKVVGHAAITTLQPGIELSDIDLSRGDLLNRVEGMTLLIPPKSVQSFLQE